MFWLRERVFESLVSLSRSIGIESSLGTRDRGKPQTSAVQRVARKVLDGIHVHCSKFGPLGPVDCENMNRPPTHKRRVGVDSMNRYLVGNVCSVELFAQFRQRVACSAKNANCIVGEGI
ncbi:hypothetical protein Y024_5277 [Burkholderia pseudomallei TSV44]|nr:hypothetical protein Y024_5277 [Burkholderia pseudomallei TSV44]